MHSRQRNNGSGVFDRRRQMFRVLVGRRSRKGPDRMFGRGVQKHAHQQPRPAESVRGVLVGRPTVRVQPEQRQAAERLERRGLVVGREQDAGQTRDEHSFHAQNARSRCGRQERRRLRVRGTARPRSRPLFNDPGRLF